MRVCPCRVPLFRIKILFQVDAKFFPKRFKVAQIFVVLAFVFDFGLNACPKQRQCIIDDIRSMSQAYLQRFALR